MTATVADFTGDGILDVVGASGYGPSGTVVVLRGNGDTTLTPLGMPIETTFIQDIASHDTDGDGDQDLIAATWNDGEILRVFRGHGDGTLDALTTTIPSAYRVDNGMDVVDFDGDGVHDVVIRNDVGLGVHIGHPNGSFDPIRMYATPGAPRVLADLDSDHRLDILAVRGDAFSSSPPQTVWQVRGTCIP